LLERYSKGEQHCFEEIVSRYKPGLLRYAGSYVHSSEDAKDIVQDVFTEFILMLHSAKYTEQGKLHHLLIKMTHHEVDEFFRRKKKHDSVFISLSENSNDAEEEQGGEEFSAEEMKIFRKTIHLLKPRDKKIVVMRYHGKHSFEDIAHRCSISTNSATKIFSRVMTSLRKRIREEMSRTLRLRSV
jgi:RNA polymerase sigma-70 factor (ECF subfamily)